MTALLGGRAATRSGIRRRPNGVLWVGAAAFITLWVVIAVFAPVLAPQDPTAVDFNSAYSGSTSTHLLGADASGRDILSRLMWGSRSALLGPLVVVALAGLLAIAIAVTAALLRGWFDAVASRLLDVIFAFPGVLLALVGVAIFGSGLVSAVGALSIAYIPYIARVVRGDALRQTSQPYIHALRLNGVSGPALAVRHLVPNLLPLIVGQLTLSFGYAMVDLASISFLGLGVQAPGSDWGLMVQEGQASIIRGYPQESIYAGVLIILMVMSFTILGDRVITSYEARAR